jgi:hypothetical protein
LVIITDSGDSMVKVGSTFTRVQNSTLVSLKDFLVSLDGHGGGSEGDGSHKSLGVVSGDVVDFGGLYLARYGGVFASLVLAVVRIVTFEGISVGFSILESIFLETSIASMGRFVTVHHLLL